MRPGSPCGLQPRPPVRTGRRALPECAGHLVVVCCRSILGRKLASGRNRPCATAAMPTHATRGDHSSNLPKRAKPTHTRFRRASSTRLRSFPSACALSGMAARRAAVGGSSSVRTRWCRRAVFHFGLWANASELVAKLAGHGRSVTLLAVGSRSAQGHRDPGRAGVTPHGVLETVGRVRSEPARSWADGLAGKRL